MTNHNQYSPSTEKPKFPVGTVMGSVGRVMGPDGELTGGMYPTRETAEEMKEEFAEREEKRKETIDKYFAGLDQIISDHKGTPVAVMARLQRARDKNQGKYSSREADEKSRKLDEKLHIEQKLLAQSCSNVGIDRDITETWQAVETRLEIMYDKDTPTTRVIGDGPFYEPIVVDRLLCIDAANDLQQRLSDEKIRASAKS